MDTRCVHEPQRVREYREPCLWLSHGAICLGEECDKIRACRCSCGRPGRPALVELLDPCLRLSLLHQCPATQDRTDRYPGRESLGLGEEDGGFGALLAYPPLAAELMEYCCHAQGIGEAQGVCQLLRQQHCVLAPCQRLVRIAQMPQRLRVMTPAHHTRVLAIEAHRGAMVRGVVEGDPLCQMRVSSGGHAPVKPGRPHRTVRRQEHSRVLGLLCQDEELLAQFVRRLELGAHEI